MHTHSLPALNPEQAIWDRDIDELTRALEAGWTLPRARSKEGGSVEDLSLVIRVISLRWVAGWFQMVKHFPALHQNAIIWTLALRQAVPGVVEDLLAHGQSPVAPLENGLLPLQAVVEAMGPRPGEPIDESDLLATAKLLVSAGADPTRPHSADFTVGDNSPGGHCVWSRAMYYGRWEIARAFLPTTWEDLTSLSRGLEMVADLRRVSQVGSNPGASRMWTDLMRQWVGSWLDSRPQELFALPPDLEVIPDLPEAGRAAVWDRWNQIDTTGWTGLHELGLSGNDGRAHRALRTAVDDGASCLAHWSRPDTSGTRPCDLWEIANQRSPAQVVTDPAQVPEVQPA